MAKSRANPSSSASEKNPQSTTRDRCPNRSGSFDATEGFWRRWRFTCYHGEADKLVPHCEATLKNREENEKSMKEFYVKAARRLPLAQIPELVDCIRTGGHCIGLADPVSNIILNAIRRLPSPFPSEEEHSRTGKTDCETGVIAAQSHLGIRVFMAAYFRYLKDRQIRRYLYLASFDLSVAIKLVHHERFSPTSHRPLLPDGGKIKAALRIAALQAGHPAPDDLAGFMTAQYPSALLKPVIDKLQGDELLSTRDVWDIKDLLSRQWPPAPLVNLEFLCRPSCSTGPQGRDDGTLLELSSCIGDDIFARISVSRGCQFNSCELGYISGLTFDCAYMDTKLSGCLLKTIVSGNHKPGATVDYDSVQCDHIMSLKMCLLDAIHALYIKALAILPSSAWRPRIVRALLVSGHCYGPMDPVSNIILNSIWFDIAFPPYIAPPDNIEAQVGILETSGMSRLEHRTLNGLVAILRATSSPTLSEHEALEYLYCWNCDLSRLCTETACNEIPFDAAAKAAKHPQYGAFGSFLNSLTPLKLTRLRSQLPAPAGGRISEAQWDQLTTFVRGESECNAVLPAPKEEDLCCLSKEAALEMSRKNSTFKDQFTFVRTELTKLLMNYCNKHPWEPCYKLDIICGVHVKSMPCSERKFFHANFLASSDAAAADHERTLFFAEFLESPPSEFVQSEASTSSCCPVSDYHACTGRCSVCEDEGSKIMHPPSGNDIGGSVSRYRSLYHSAVRVCNIGYENLIESDYIYFDHYRDFERGKIINDFCEKRPIESDLFSKLKAN